MSQSGRYSQGSRAPSIETITGNSGGPVGPDGAFNINLLGSGALDVAGNPGTNTLTISLAGSVADSFPTDAGTATPAAGILNVFGGASTAGININTSGAGNTVSIALNDSILLPFTNNTGTEGVIFLGGDRFLHNYGSNNTFLGQLSGNLSLTILSAFDNVGIGTQSLESLTEGGFNSAVGSQALITVTSGTCNDALGALAGTDGVTGLATGSYNVLIGGSDGIVMSAGSNYTGAESSNILIRNMGITGESNTIRIGTSGNGDGAQDRCFIAGIEGVTPAVAGARLMLIDTNDQLGSLGSATNGQIPIGSTGANPVLATLTPGTGVSITNGAGSITIAAAASVATSYVADTGSATPAANVLNVLGGASTAGTNIATTGAGNTLSVSLKDSIFFPNTNAAGTQGVINYGGTRFIHNYGTNNTFLGQGAGNLTLIVGNATTNTAVGYDALKAITTADSNVAVGNGVLQSATAGDNNTVVGTNAFGFITTGRINTGLGANVGNNNTNPALGVSTGSFNILIGGDDNGSEAAGSNYIGPESSNIIIGNNGGVASENNVIRIGVSGSGDAQQDACYIAGIYNRSIGATAGVVTIDDDDKLGSSNGSNGQLLIGGGTGPVWANLTSTGGTVTITNGANSINLEAGGGFSFTWNEVTGTSQTMSVNNGYIANNAGLVTLTLPAVAALGDVIRVTGKGAGGWLIAQNAGQTVYFGTSTTTTGAGGSLSSTATRDTVELVCVTANNDWNVISSVGNITVT